MPSPAESARQLELKPKLYTAGLVFRRGSYSGETGPLSYFQRVMWAKLIEELAGIERNRDGEIEEPRNR